MNVEKIIMPPIRSVSLCIDGLIFKLKMAGASQSPWTARQSWNVQDRYPGDHDFSMHIDTQPSLRE